MTDSKPNLFLKITLLLKPVLFNNAVDQLIIFNKVVCGLHRCFQSYTYLPSDPRVPPFKHTETESMHWHLGST